MRSSIFVYVKQKQHVMSRKETKIDIKINILSDMANEQCHAGRVKENYVNNMILIPIVFFFPYSIICSAHSSNKMNKILNIQQLFYIIYKLNLKILINEYRHMIIVHFIILNADLLSTKMILHKTAMGNCDNVCIH